VNLRSIFISAPSFFNLGVSATLAAGPSEEAVYRALCLFSGCAGHNSTIRPGHEPEAPGHAFFRWLKLV
jgi:hypothetical protein